MKMPIVSRVLETSSLLGGILILGIIGASSTPADDTSDALYQAPKSGHDDTQLGNNGLLGDSGTVSNSISGTTSSYDEAAHVVRQERIVQAKPEGPIATKSFEAMQTVHELDGELNLQDLASRLTTVVEVPFWLDERAIEFANIDPAKQSITLNSSGEILATSLRRVLQPLGLKAVVQNEGIVVTADRVALARKGIGATSWVNVDHESAAQIEAAMEQKTTVNFVQETLDNALTNIGKTHGITIAIDAKSLDEIGLNGDCPVSVSLSEVKLRTVLEAILNPLDLTLTIDREFLKVTTTEAAEAQPLVRVYLVSGAGFPKGSVTTAINLIQTTLSPDVWETMGGPSTMSEIVTDEECSIVVATMYEVHHEIEMLLTRLRETHFGDDPIVGTIGIPRNNTSDGMRSGGMF